MNREVTRTLCAVVVYSALIGLARVVAGRTLGAVGVEADGWHTLAETMSLGLALTGLRMVSGHVFVLLEVWLTRALAIWMIVLALELALYVWHGGTQVTLAAGPLCVLLPTIALQVVLARFQERVAAQTGSMLLRGNAAHTRADALSTVGVVAAAVIAGFGIPWIDRLAGIAVAVAIGVSAVELLQDLKTEKGPGKDVRR